jgi:hypothetical protein
MGNNGLIIPEGDKPSEDVLEKIAEFMEAFQTFESKSDVCHMLLRDRKSDAYYLICHLDSKVISAKADLEAVLDPQESEDYKLNRNIYTDTYAYRLMEKDAKEGRSFEDIVVEYDTSYRPEKPLKVFGGQHRIQAINEAAKKGILVPQGIRVYFNLSVEQKFDIATANNTSIAVSNDLLDRMQEEIIGKELREWCQTVGLLKKGQNFADKRSSEGIPTVRIARTLIVNFYLGKEAQKNDFHLPVVCSTGTGIDKNYMKFREIVDWDDKALKIMGEQFAKLHRVQREKVFNRAADRFLEYANKAIHPTVAAGWAYAVGLFQSDSEALKVHYKLPDSPDKTQDPLNAKALSQARLKGTDPENYRGLGARISSGENGRMFAVFLLQATKTKAGINLPLANAAIKTFESVRLQHEAKKALKEI